MAAIETCGRHLWVGGQHEEEEVNGNRATVSEYLPSIYFPQDLQGINKTPRMELFMRLLVRYAIE